MTTLVFFSKKNKILNMNKRKTKLNHLFSFQVFMILLFMLFLSTVFPAKGQIVPLPSFNKEDFGVEFYFIFP